MLQIISGIAVAPFIVALMLNFRRMAAAARSIRREPKWLLYAWALMFLGMGLFLGKRTSGVSGITSFDSSAVYQTTSVSIAALIGLGLFAGSNAINNLSKPPVLLLLIYGLHGVMSFLYSPNPAFSAYKASLILIDVILMSASLSYFKRGVHCKTLLEFFYTLVTLMVAVQLVAAALLPDRAFLPASGILGVILYGSYPFMNPNSLGFLAAISSVISVRRLTESKLPFGKFYYATLLITSLMVLFLAQSRTAVASFVIVLFMMTYLIPKLRRYSYAVGAVIFLAVITLLATGKLTDFMSESVSTTTDYIERGQDDSNLSTLSGRTEAWAIGMDLFLESPIAGLGFDAGVKAAIGSHMHNSHVQILVNSGVIGYVTWVLLVATVSFRVFFLIFSKRFRRKEADYRYHVEVASILLIIVLRTLTGSILVVHGWDMLIFIAIIIYLYLLPKEGETTMVPAPYNTTAQEPRILRYRTQKPE